MNWIIFWKGCKQGKICSSNGNKISIFEWKYIRICNLILCYSTYKNEWVLDELMNYLIFCTSFSKSFQHSFPASHVLVCSYDSCLFIFSVVELSWVRASLLNCEINFWINAKQEFHLVITCNTSKGSKGGKLENELGLRHFCITLWQLLELMTSLALKKLDTVVINDVAKN